MSNSNLSSIVKMQRATIKAYFALEDISMFCSMVNFDVLNSLLEKASDENSSTKILLNISATLAKHQDCDDIQGRYTALVYDKLIELVVFIGRANHKELKKMIMENFIDENERMILDVLNTCST